MAANLPQRSAIPMNLPQTFSREQLLACASGAMFGPQGARLPSDPMLMFDRITEIREDGGRHDKGIIRAELDIRNEKIKYKVREHSLQKVPYLFVVGKREAEERNVAIRQLGSDGQNIQNVDVAIEDLQNAARPPY